MRVSVSIYLRAYTVLFKYLYCVFKFCIEMGSSFFPSVFSRLSGSAIEVYLTSSFFSIFKVIIKNNLHKQHHRENGGEIKILFKKQH